MPMVSGMLIQYPLHGLRPLSFLAFTEESHQSDAQQRLMYFSCTISIAQSLVFQKKFKQFKSKNVDSLLLTTMKFQWLPKSNSKLLRSCLVSGIVLLPHHMSPYRSLSPQALRIHTTTNRKHSEVELLSIKPTT